MRIVGGLIDVVILIIINAIVAAILQKAQGVPGSSTSLSTSHIRLTSGAHVANRSDDAVWLQSSRCRDRPYPTIGKGRVRGFIWTLDGRFTVCIIGAIAGSGRLGSAASGGPRQDAGTIVTTA